MTPITTALPDGHTWLRVAKASWVDPLDTTHAAHSGGRWNPPRSHATLYLNEDVATARSQLPRMLDGFPATPEDLDDEFVLVRATLPSGQVVADAVSDEGLEALGLPGSYPHHANGRP
ncbi:MAG: RES domain-containing protein, partial [Acidimicrobiia bacterium]